MNEDIQNTVNRLRFEDLIWISFIVISIFDIYGDSLIRRSLLQGDKEANKKANHLFLGIVSFSILIYIYFFARNYKDYQKYKTKNYEVRLVGSSLILLGTFCLFYFQLTNTQEVDSTSVI